MHRRTRTGKLARFALLGASTVLALPLSATTVVPGRLDVDWHAQITSPRFFEYASYERSTPVADPSRGWLFVADRFGVVRAFDAAFEPRWQADVGATVEAGLLFQEERLYVVTVRGRVFCLDARSGRELWRYDGKNELGTTPTLADGRLLVPSLADTLLALDAESGDFLWFYRRPRPEGLTILGSSRAVVDGSRVILGFSDGGVVALDIEDARVLWRTVVGSGDHRDVNATPVVSDGTVYVASYAGTLHALDASTGREQWTRSGLRGAMRMDRVADRLIIAASGMVAAHRLLDGAVLWQTALSDTGAPSEISIHGNSICVGTERGPLVVMSVSNGKPYLAFDPGTGVSAGAFPDAQGLWLFSNGGRLYRLSWPG